MNLLSLVGRVSTFSEARASSKIGGNFPNDGSNPDSKNLGQRMGPIWQAQLGESLVMLIGPSWAPKFIALLETKFWAH